MKNKEIYDLYPRVTFHCCQRERNFRRRFVQMREVRETGATWSFNLGFGSNRVRLGWVEYLGLIFVNNIFH